MANRRGEDELDIVAVGVQPARFGRLYGRSHEETSIPSISPWRCNLTALSQTENLYFVAYGAQIYVYIPQFPSQHVPCDPALILTSRPSGPGQQGYLDRSDPHSINHLLVSFLGNDEVVATVRDDGDVDMVLVRHVAQAIQRRAEPGNTLGSEAVEVRPMFQQNVGMSAWGLAIHSQARILATSSNLHEIRVIKFGLVYDDSEQAEQPADQLTPDDRQQTRFTDIKQRVISGNANIPYISFCNTGDDPTGRWLVTTDIAGYCRIMDLHSRKPGPTAAQTFTFKHRRDLWSGDVSFDRVHAGWCILFLDRRSFQEHSKWHTATGFPRENTLAKGLKHELWDLSQALQHIPQNSSTFRRHARTQSRDGSQQSPSNESRTTDRTARSPGSEDEYEEGLDESLLTVEDDDHSEDSDNRHLLSPQNRSLGTLLLGESDEDPDDDAMVGATAPGFGGISTNQAIAFHSRGPTCHGLPCPIFHASAKNIFLLQPPDAHTPNQAFAPPLVGFSTPARQAVEAAYADLNVFDRMNMVASVPELGVVVVASQKGRAIVLALTKMPGSSIAPFHPPSTPQESKTYYAMRVERILPLDHQERGDERPFAPLHGIAVGPMQGTEQHSEDRRRWRLMLMYQDHTILSYEISRNRTGCVSHFSVDQVLV